MTHALAEGSAAARRRAPPGPPVRRGARERARPGGDLLRRSRGSSSERGALLPLARRGGRPASRRGAVSSRELVEAALARIEATDARIGAFLRTTPERARAAAAAVGRARARGRPALAPRRRPDRPEGHLPHEGRRDHLRARGSSRASSRPTTRPSWSGSSAAGAVVLGKLNMDEFAMGSSNENSAFGPCHNPWDLARTPGGSLGRQRRGGGRPAGARRRSAPTPAARSGCRPRSAASSGVKPTYGRVSRYGVIAFASLARPGRAPSAAPSATRRCSCRPSPATIRAT